MIINFGCGYDVHEDAVNVDLVANEERGVVELSDVLKGMLEPKIEVVRMFHVLEHIQYPLDVFQQLYPFLKANAQIVVRVPYGTSRDAWENPTHVRPWFYTSFGPLSQLYWWRENAPEATTYSASGAYDHRPYSGDYQIEDVILFIKSDIWRVCKDEDGEINVEDIMWHVERSNDIVAEMVATLRVVKPARVVVKGTKSEFPAFNVTVLEAKATDG